MMFCGIDDNDMKRIVEIIGAHQKVIEAILFGSRALGSFEAGSDIDIALKGSELKLNDIIDLKISLDDLLLPYKMDLIIYDRISEPDLIDHINRVGINLFAR